MLTPNQVAVTATATPLVTFPPGPCTVILSNIGPDTVYVGASGVTTSNGFPIPSGAPPVMIPGYGGSGATKLYGICASTQTAAVGVIVSTATGGTGL